MKHICVGVSVNAWVQAQVCSGHSDIEAGSSVGTLVLHGCAVGVTSQHRISPLT